MGLGVLQLGIKDSWAALAVLLPDPVSRLPGVIADIGPRRSGVVGVVYAILFALCVWLGATIMLSRIPFASMSAGTHVKLLLFSLVPYVGLVAACVVARALAHSRGGGVSGDMYYVGVAILPLGGFALVSGILGMAVPELALALLVLALCLHVLLLFKGASVVGGMGERTASLAVPVILLLAAWITSVFLRSAFMSGVGDMISPFMW
jgi:hypothetical protein